MSALLELAERCEKATGDNFDLNHAIAAALGIASEPFTGSLDAALTLVPEGMREDRYYLAIEQVWYETAGWEARFDTPGDECGNGDTILAKANTPALALCAAALRARAAGESA